MEFTTSKGHSPGDATLVAFAKTTGYIAVTGERRLSNLFNNTYQKLGVPIQRHIINRANFNDGCVI